MAINAGLLRHRIDLQQPVYEQNQTTGDKVVAEWATVARLWAAVVPVSGREFMAAQAEQSKVSARITTRYKGDVLPSMRIVHNGDVYNIEAILPDPDSGFEYITIMVSTGVRDEFYNVIDGDFNVIDGNLNVIDF